MPGQEILARLTRHLCANRRGTCRGHLGSADREVARGRLLRAPGVWHALQEAAAANGRGDCIAKRRVREELVGLAEAEALAEGVSSATDDDDAAASAFAFASIPPFLPLAVAAGFFSDCTAFLPPPAGAFPGALLAAEALPDFAAAFMNASFVTVPFFASLSNATSSHLSPASRLAVGLSIVAGRAEAPAPILCVVTTCLIA